MKRKHEIRIEKYLSQGKWIIRIFGVTSGVKIHGGDGDDMNIEFKLDADRFEPVIIK